MSDKVFIKNIPFSDAVDLKELVDYESGRVVSRTLSQRQGVGITLFAFDKGEEISTHTAPGDAMVIVLDGRTKITIGDKVLEVSEGQTVVMPANTPHALEALERFKMLLVVVKP